MNFRGRGTIPENKKSKKHAELADQIYQLGYEVGYNNHSEIGWVLRDKSKLLHEAQKQLIDSPENYYNEGKTKGKLSREKGIEGSGNTGNNIIPPVKVDSPKTNDSFDDKDVRKRAYHLPKNKISELPQMVKKISVTEIPEFLKGIKHLRRK
ncbi:MAG: hypothetical protein CVV36_08320 [Candidatus Methanoperedenaceae archaeon HGW-Methanoperedenaceae-1]|jgi:hypothetical protein|nr:MAG: hypothetical protein CVV36_08320 [Candidatus Methanoperedenaceae archaeon HGW-Methanoperedenaceae-1]